MHKTKIICTIGPASRKEDVLSLLISNGMDVARINMSHGSQQEHQQVIDLIRTLAGQLGKNVAVLGDLQGPKIRLGEIAGEAVLNVGDVFVLTVEPIIGNTQKASVDHPGFYDDVKPGAKVFINDGKIQLEVIEVSPPIVKTKVLVGGELKAHKGVNLPGAKVSLPALTNKDKGDLEFLLRQEVEYIACSFIRSSQNVREIKQVMLGLGKQVPLIAKLETREGIQFSRAILQEAEGIMVARGDMAVELPFEEIPIVQKVLLDIGKEMGKPVIVATQMLESMTENPNPTRAEMTDVANAVIQGAWGVMLSGETAAGRYPVEAVQAMAKLVNKTELALLDGKISFEDLGIK